MTADTRRGGFPIDTQALTRRATTRRRRPASPGCGVRVAARTGDGDRRRSPDAEGLDEPGARGPRRAALAHTCLRRARVSPRPEAQGRSAPLWPKVVGMRSQRGGKLKDMA